MMRLPKIRFLMGKSCKIYGFTLVGSFKGDLMLSEKYKHCQDYRPLYAPMPCELGSQSRFPILTL